MIKTILFDFDGTLANTNRLIAQSHLSVLDRYFPGEYDEESVKIFNGPPLDEVYGQLLPEKKDQVIAEYREFNHAHHDDLITSFPKVTEVLTELKKLNIQMAIVSTKRRDTVLRGLEILKIRDFFDLVLGGDDYEQAKPDPESILLAIDRLHADIDSTIMIGDNWHDIQAANRAGVRSVFVEWSEKSLTEILPYHPYKTIGNMLELLQWVTDENQKVANHMIKQKVAVLGAGSWGTALSKVLAENGHNVFLWSHNPDQIKEMTETRYNQHYLPDTYLVENIYPTADLSQAIMDADAVLFVVPTKAIRSVAEQFAQLCQNHPTIIHASKGLEQGTHKRISEILAEEIPPEKRNGIVVLSGPSHAEEVARQDITTITAASNDRNAAHYVQQLFSNHYFRVYTNDDVIGVEMGAALKNIIALGAGAIAGLGYGDNAKAAIITRGLAEISRLGVAMGADPLTFIGLSGVGDLIVTGTSVHSRNWRAGDLLGKGKDLEDILENMGMIVEGVSTTKAAYELSQQLHVDMPITASIYRVLYENEPVEEAAKNIMLREKKSEKEF